MQGGGAGAPAARAAARPVTRGSCMHQTPAREPARRSSPGSGPPGDARRGARPRHWLEACEAGALAARAARAAFCCTGHASELGLALGLPRGCSAGHGEGGCVGGWCSGSRLAALQAGCRISDLHVGERAASAGAVTGGLACCHPRVAVCYLGEAWSVSLCSEVLYASAFSRKVHVASSALWFGRRRRRIQ